MLELQRKKRPVRLNGEMFRMKWSEKVYAGNNSIGKLYSHLGAEKYLSNFICWALMKARSLHSKTRFRYQKKMERKMEKRETKNKYLLRNQSKRSNIQNNFLLNLITLKNENYIRCWWIKCFQFHHYNLDSYCTKV